MSEYTIHNEADIVTVNSTDEMPIYQASSGRLKKATPAEIATYLAATPGAVAATAAMLDAEQYIIQAADSSADSNAGLDSASAAAVFTTNNGAITLGIGTYFFEGNYYLTNTGTTSHTWAVLFGGTAVANAAGTAYQAFGNSGTTANTPATGGLSGFFTGATITTAVVVTAASTSATEQVAVQLTGTLSIGTAGTLIPQMKASARPGATGTPGVVHKAGSFFRIWQVPTLGTQGNWS
ncbi:MAG: hypothetical protein KGM49_15625 [Sphingomonadales bacterium]|nr:hypothetical protein [Sphingomonadales bacterium]